MWKSLVDIDVRKVGAVAGFVTAIAVAIATGQVSLDHMVSASCIPAVKAWCAFIAFAGGILVGAHNSTALWSPRVQDTTTKALAIFAVLLTSMLFMPSDAYAQNRAAPKPVEQTEAAAVSPPCLQPVDPRPACKNGIFAPGGVGTTASGATATPQQVWQNIITAAGADLTYAKALADSAATPNSKLRSTCYGAIIAANQQVSGANIPKDTNGNPMTMPDPALISHAEQGLEIIDGLQPTSPLIVACGPAANAINMSVLNFINTIVTGAALKAATGGILP